MVGDHGELRSGETRPRRRLRKNGQWPSPTARMARLSGGERRGGHGGALVELWFAFLRWCASSATAKLEWQWRSGLSSLAARGGGEEMKIGLANWSGRPVGGFTSWLATPGHLRRVAVRSDGRRRVAPRVGRFLKTVGTVAV